jgi:hypothetical protein
VNPQLKLRAIVSRRVAAGAGNVCVIKFLSYIGFARQFFDATIQQFTI